MPFIRRARVREPGTRNDHVTAVLVSATTTGPLTVATPDAVARSIGAGTQYFALDEARCTRTIVLPRIGPGDRRYVTTVAGGRETDDLLRLPRF